MGLNRFHRGHAYIPYMVYRPRDLYESDYMVYRRDLYESDSSPCGLSPFKNTCRMNQFHKNVTLIKKNPLLHSWVGH